MKKLIALLLAAMMLLACVPALADTLTMCTNASFPPYEYVAGADGVIGEFAGIDIEIFKAICDKLGYEPAVVDTEFSSCIPGVQGGKYDVALGAITVTEERKQLIDFTDSYSTGIQVVMVREGGTITSLDQLYEEGHNWQIGVQAGTTGDIYCLDDFDGKTGTVLEYLTGNEAAIALAAGKIDCVIIDDQPAQNYVAANEGLTILESAYTTEEYAIVVSKDKPELLAAINGALAELKADGTIDAILAKYIKAD